MLAIKFFFCFAATLVFFSGVSTFHIPADNVKLSCNRVCENELRGKTYSCDMFSSQGVVTAVVRMIFEFNWRFYVIPKMAPESNFCQRILAADQYFLNGTSRCPSSLRSAKTSPIDTSELQSTRRAEVLKGLLKELNEDTTKVLTNLFGIPNKGSRSLTQAITPSKKAEIQLVLEKLVDHLSIVGWLNEDVKFHQNSATHSIQPSQPKQPSHQGPPSSPINSKYTSLSNYPGASGQTGYSGASGQAGYPGTSGQTGYSGPSEQAGYPGSSSQTGYPGSSSQTGYLGASGQTGYQSKLSPKNFYNPGMYDYNQFDQNAAYDGPNSYDYSVNNDDMYNTHDDAKNLGPNQHPYGMGQNFPQPAGFGQVPMSRKRIEEDKDTKVNKVEEVKELAAKLQVESSELLKDLENNTISEGSTRKKNGFVKFIKHLVKILILIKVNNFKDGDDDYEIDEIVRRADSSNSSDESQTVEGRSLLEQRLDAGVSKRKFTHDTSDERGECALCSVALRDVCNDGKIVVCDDSKCCWMSFNPYYCMATLNDKSALTCYNSLYNILQSSRILNP